MKVRVIKRPAGEDAVVADASEVAEQLPEGWASCTMGDVSTVVGGGTPKASDPSNFSDDGYPWIGPADLTHHKGMYIERGRRSLSESGMRDSSAVMLPPGTVLFSSRAPIGHVAVARGSVSTNQGFRSFLPRSGVVSEYLYFYLRFATPLAEALSSGTTFPEISGSNCARIPLMLPPTAEQRRIAEAVETLLARVEAARARLDRVPAILKRFRQSVLAAACSGRLTEDWRRENAKIVPFRLQLDDKRQTSHRGMSSRDLTVPALARDEADDEIPPAWIWTHVGDVVDIQNGRSFPSGEYGDTGLRLVRPGNLHQSGRIEWTEKNTVRLPSSWAARFPDFLLGSGELLINLTAQSLKDEFLGRVCMTVDDEPALLNQRIGRFVNQGAQDLRPYLYVYFKSPRFRDFVDTLDTGSLIRHMHSKQVVAHRMPLPPVKEQQEIVRRVEALFALADAVERRVAVARKQASSLPQAILARAFSGELVPTEAELARREGREYEPGSVLLERIRQERAESTQAPRPTRRRRPTSDSRA